MRAKLFISYRRADAAQAAGRIRDSLHELFPQSVFVDVEDIQPGDDFVAAIRSSLDSAAALIVVIGARWLEGSATGTRLGDPTDYVTVELETAIRLGVPILPILVDGAEMPRQTDLPATLHAILRFNALQVRHVSFHRDMDPLIAFAYKALRLTPPTQLEQVMEKLAGKMGYGTRFKYDEKMRDWHATGALIFGFLSVAAAVGCVALEIRPDFDSLMIAASSVYVALIGRNSREKGRRANVGLALTLASMAISAVQVFRLTGV